MRKKHWLRFLPEVGNPFLRRAERLEAKRQDIRDMEACLRQLRVELAQAEEEAEREASRLWSDLEIKCAKAEAWVNHATKREG